MHRLRTERRGNGSAHPRRAEARVGGDRDTPALPGTIGQSARLGRDGKPLRRSRAARRRARHNSGNRADAGAARAIEAAAFRSQGQARHLPIHVRRAAADRSARLQAEPGCAVQQGHARLGARQPAIDGHDRGTGAFSHCAFALAIQAVRPDGNLGERPAALHRAHGRRPDHREVGQHRRHQSRTGDHADEHRQHECRQAVPRFVARLRTGQHERQPAHLHRAADQDQCEGE